MGRVIHMPDEAICSMIKSTVLNSGKWQDSSIDMVDAAGARQVCNFYNYPQSDHYIWVAALPPDGGVPFTLAQLQSYGVGYFIFFNNNGAKVFSKLATDGNLLNSYEFYNEQAHTNNTPRASIGSWTWNFGSSWWGFDYVSNAWATNNYGSALFTDNTRDLYVIESTIPLQIDDTSYDPGSADERILAKNVGEYTFNVGVAANESSAHPTGTYIWSTLTYKINVHWTSQRTGTTFSKDLDNLIHNQSFFTYPPLFPNYCFSTASSVGMFAKAYRMPIGVYETVADIPVDFEDCTAVRSVITMSLNELKAIAETQQAGVVNDDLFTEIFFDFIDSSNLQIIETKSIDYGSLFGRDIDLGGSTFPDPNDAEGLADDNKYTDHIDLTTPTLTATGVFNRCYVLDGNGVNDLCDFLYNADDNIFDEIVDGVLTRGSPIDSLIDLRLYPFDVRAFTGAGTPEFIKFGRIQTTVAASRLPHDANAVIDLGSCTVPREYNNFLDYQTTAQLYIPFCGVCELPMDRVLNHELSIKLIVDYVTGSGTAVVFVDNLPLLYQQGVIGVSIPMTATNSAEFGKTIAGNLVKTAADAVSGDLGGAAAGALDSAAAIWQGSKIQKAGASSPQTSLYQPKNAYLLLSLVNPAPKVWEDEYADIAGYATFMPIAAIGDLSPGFTAFDNVKLNIPGATERERDMILQLLKEGIYI